MLETKLNLNQNLWLIKVKTCYVKCEKLHVLGSDTIIFDWRWEVKKSINGKLLHFLIAFYQRKTSKLGRMTGINVFKPMKCTNTIKLTVLIFFLTKHHSGIAASWRENPQKLQTVLFIEEDTRILLLSQCSPQFFASRFEETHNILS